MGVAVAVALGGTKGVAVTDGVEVWVEVAVLVGVALAVAGEMVAVGVAEGVALEGPNTKSCRSPMQ